jgi:hypothetical protein
VDTIAPLKGSRGKHDEFRTRKCVLQTFDT